MVAKKDRMKEPLKDMKKMTRRRTQTARKRRVTRKTTLKAVTKTMKMKTVEQ